MLNSGDLPAVEVGKKKEATLDAEFIEKIDAIGASKRAMLQAAKRDADAASMQTDSTKAPTKRRRLDVDNKMEEMFGEFLLG